MNTNNTFQKTLETIKFIIYILPEIINAVKQIEQIFPESGKGQMKLALVIEALTQVKQISNEYIPVIEDMINAVVRIFNTFGVFTTKE